MSWKVLVTARAYDVVGEAARRLLEANDCEVVVPKQFGPLNPELLRQELVGIDATLCSPDDFTEEVLSLIHI